MAGEYSKYIKAAALRHQISPQLIAAVIHQESSGNSAAMRYEPHFFRKHFLGKTPASVKLTGYVSKLASFQTELNGRATSWGLMQTLGETARCFGFKGEFFTELCLNPELNIQIGSKYLAHCLEKAGWDTAKGLLIWNGGGNKEYPGEVIANLQAGHGDYLL